MTHHNLDIYPVPREKNPLYINEPWLTDASLLDREPVSENPEDYKDNVRIYVPMDLNREAILRRLDATINHYGEVNEGNELDFLMSVNMLISQLEIYDQVWFTRHMPEHGKHSVEVVELAGEFVKRLEAIPDGCAECFPFGTIEELRKEYLETK